MIDISRSVGVFDPSKLKEVIHVIGVGATGSHVVDGLLSLGIRGSKIHVYDFDTVEEHNIANQFYTIADVGKPKVSALKELMLQKYGEEINIHNTKLESPHIEGIIFLLVDTFESRLKIFKSLSFKPNVKLVVETRLDARVGQIHLLDPRDMKHVEWFEKSMPKSDAEDTSEVSACGTRQVISQTVYMLAGMAIWQLIHWSVDPTRAGEKIYFATHPWYIEQDRI